jgi:hypothetical protein
VAVHYLRPARAVRLHLYVGPVSRVYSTSISQFSAETHKIEVAPKPWEWKTEIGKVPNGEAGVA